MLRKVAAAVMVGVLVLVQACAGVQAPKPKVLMPAQSYPNSGTFNGVAIAAIPFDPNRSIYADPNDVRPQKPDFNWYKAGVCPTRFIFDNKSDKAYLIDPSQFTCTDAAGTTYKPYDAKEAGDAVVASDAFNSYVKGALAGAILGAVVGAGLGAAIGGIAGGGNWAARGAALGAASGGGQGLVLGAVRNRAEMESRTRMAIISEMMKPQLLAPGMTHDGIIFFPAVDMASVKMVATSPGGKDILQANMPIIMPLQGDIGMSRSGQPEDAPKSESEE